MIKLTGRIMPKRLFGKVRIDYGPYNGTLQSKIVEPSTEDQNVVADNGYNALSLVLVKAATLQEKMVTPSSQEQTIVPDVGVYGLSKVIVEPQGDHGLLEEITVTPTQEEQKITPNKGYYGIDVVNVEAAPLEEVTIYPSYETQTIRPSEGYYGIGSIVVEAMDDPGSGGGDGGGGSGGGEVITYPSADGITFGTETITEEVETGNYLYGDIVAPPLPNPEYPYVVITTNDAGTFAYAFCYTNAPTTVTINEDSIILRFPHGTEYGKWESRYGGEWHAQISGGITRDVLFQPIVWWNFTAYDEYGEVAMESMDSRPETETVTYEQTVERDESYLIGGDTLNSIVGIAQKVTGNTGPMTVEEATKALTDYGVRPSAEEEGF